MVSVPLLRTLVLCDLVDSTALVERMGDQRAAELFRKHDRLTRSLVQQYNGKEIDKTDGFLLMFERPIQAVGFALDYQRGLKQLNAIEKTTLASRVGIHVGDVLTWDNAPDDIAKGAKQVEVEGLVKPITSRLMHLALPKQILLSGVAYSLAHRAQGELGAQLDVVRWRTHGRYRFKGIPDPIPVFEVGDEGIAPLKAPPWSGKAHREVPFWRRPATMGMEIGLVFLLLAIPAWYLFKPAPAIAFANRDWVVVGDLKNLTGDPRFDDSVETALRIGLEQSRYVNVLSDLKTRATVQLMQRDPDKTVIDRTVGSEVAIRDGVRALILPTVAEIGGRVRVTAEVIDPNTQTTVYSESADGLGEASVLPSLDKVNRQLRERLGEALATVSVESQPLEKATTRNLDALRAYTLATRAYNVDRLKESNQFFDQALKLDPDFALARIGLARTLFAVDQNAQAREQVRLAAELRDRLSAREALYVEAWQATFGPQLPALEKWKTFAALYPDFFPAAGSYGYFAWQWANRYDDALEAVKKAASSFNPNRSTSELVLGALYLAKNKYSDAADSFNRAGALGLTAQNVYLSSMYAAQRQFGKADAALARGKSNGVAGSDLETRLARVAFKSDQGDWSEAFTTLASAKREAGLLGTRKVRQIRGVERSLRAWSESPTDQLIELREYLQSETVELKRKDDIDHADTIFNVLLGGYLGAHVGDPRIAKNALREPLPEARSGGYPLLSQMLVVTEAEQSRAEGHPENAIKALKELIDGGELCVAHVALMDAYAAANQTESALAEALWLIEHRGRAYMEINSQSILTPFNVMQSDLALLRAAEFSSILGRKNDAREQLAAFLKAWPRANEAGFVAPRIKKLKSTLGS